LKRNSDRGLQEPASSLYGGIDESKPVINQAVDRLYSIPGSVPNPINMPNYCYFRDRCERRIAACDGEYPKEVFVSNTHMATCYLYYADQAKVL